MKSVSCPDKSLLQMFDPQSRLCKPRRSIDNLSGTGHLVWTFLCGLQRQAITYCSTYALKLAIEIYFLFPFIPYKMDKLLFYFQINIY